LVLEDIDGFEWLIKELVKNCKTEIIRFTGGEPLKNPHIIKLIQITKGTGVKKIGLTTNGILLSEMEGDLLNSGIDEYAVHLCQLDSSPINLPRIKGVMDSSLKKFHNVKFNIVVTSQNKRYMADLVIYAIEHDINLLLLDLLQAGNSDKDFSDNFQRLNFVRDMLLRQGFSETIENTNSKIYSSSASRASIKLLEHYSDPYVKCSYCTRKLAYHPILITPDFQLSVCTHFGQKFFSIADAVTNRDIDMLNETIVQLKSYISQCSDCLHYTTLFDVTRAELS
jgi:molybdenum cofactor biosynthesis enzyme MoaA